MKNRKRMGCLRSESARNTDDDALSSQTVQTDIGLLGVVLLELDAGVKLRAFLDIAVDGGLDLVCEGGHVVLCLC